MKQPETLSASARLRLGRAYMETHGFSPKLRDGRCVCFLGAMTDSGAFDNGPENYLENCIRMHLGPGVNFAANSLERHGFNTEKALAVFDAAIATAEQGGN